jgi:hypothetical protein
MVHAKVGPLKVEVEEKERDQESTIEHLVKQTKKHWAARKMMPGNIFTLDSSAS